MFHEKKASCIRRKNIKLVFHLLNSIDRSLIEIQSFIKSVPQISLLWKQLRTGTDIFTKPRETIIMEEEKLPKYIELSSC